MEATLIFVHLICFEDQEKCWKTKFPKNGRINISYMKLNQHYLFRNVNAVMQLLPHQHRMQMVQKSFQMSVPVFERNDDRHFLPKLNKVRMRFW